MSRFGNLEFGESEDQSSDFQKPLLKDEAFYLKEALTAFQTLAATANLPPLTRQA